MNRKIRTVIVLVILTAFALHGCNRPEYITQEAANDEIMLQIQLNIKEDIGLLIVDYDANGSGGSGGTSNADKSLLKHDEMIFYALSKQDFGNLSDVGDLTVKLTIITEYVDPNYENIYPEEYTKPLDAISFDADFGGTYSITINGDKVNGYTAVLDDQNADVHNRNPGKMPLAGLFTSDCAWCNTRINAVHRRATRQIAPFR